jgi:hypothetical protein
LSTARIASIVPSAALDERGEWSAIDPVLSRQVTATNPPNPGHPQASAASSESSHAA